MRSDPGSRRLGAVQPQGLPYYLLFITELMRGSLGDQQYAFVNEGRAILA
jgi:hypothetical protein